MEFQGKNVLGTPSYIKHMFVIYFQCNKDLLCNLKNVTDVHDIFCAHLINYNIFLYIICRSNGKICNIKNEIRKNWRE